MLIILIAEIVSSIIKNYIYGVYFLKKCMKTRENRDKKSCQMLFTLGQTRA